MPRCSNPECREKFETKTFCRKYCYRDECNNMEYERLKAKAIKKAEQAKRKHKKENETVQDLMKKAQKVFNEFIRIRDKGKNCISCLSELKGKYDAGHYVSSGSCKALTFNERNVHGQCVHCNQHKHGNLISYREGLEERIGIVWVQHLEVRRNETANYTREELRHLINQYKQKVKDLKKAIAD